jgi:hypothetical protein
MIILLKISKKLMIALVKINFFEITKIKKIKKFIFMKFL